MKLLIRQQLQAMKERGGLDVLLPQLLSELGYEVIHHPRIGGRQAGVDVAAVGPDPDADGERTMLLFVIKSGDVGRADWDGSLQAVRPSLGEVIDDYIPNRVPQQYRGLPIAVCVCLGARSRKESAPHGAGSSRTTPPTRFAFGEWNGDRLANLILSGVLKQELLDPDHRSHFQKAIALVSEPEESYLNFRALLDALTEDLDPGPAGTTRLRQMLICLWILVGNGFDAENLDAPYRACELALLHAWDAYARRWYGVSDARHFVDRPARLRLCRRSALRVGNAGSARRPACFSASREEKARGGALGGGSVHSVSRKVEHSGFHDVGKTQCIVSAKPSSPN